MYMNTAKLNYVYQCREQLSLSENFTLFKQDMGLLNLPTGKLVANDPLALFEETPFLMGLPIGKYPVSIFVMQDKKQDDKRVALAAIYFNQNKAVKWEMAITSSKQNISKLGKKEYFGYGVDSGTGGFMDEKTIQYLKSLPKEAFDKIIFEVLNAELGKSYIHTYSTLNYTFDETDGLNMIAFSSGYGDGSYPSYHGYDENENICSLVTEFGILDD